MELKELILGAWDNRELLKEAKYADAVRAVIEEVDKGRLRVAEKNNEQWQVNEWVKQAILMYFGIQQMQTWELAPFEFYDKMLLKKDVNKQYVAPPFVSNGQNGTTEFVVAGVRIIECNAITVNTMILGCTGFAKIYEEPGVTVATGYDGSDWSEDMMTLKARRRLNILIRTQDQVGFARVTSISTALTTLAT